MKLIRVFICFIITALILPLFASCGLDTVSDYSPRQIAEIIIAAQDNIPELFPLVPEDDYFEYYLADIYRLEASMLAEGIIYYADEMSASEIAVFLLNGGADAKEIKNLLLDYIDRRIGDFTGYAPEQAAILEKGIVTVRGKYVALLICEDPQSAESEFGRCFSVNPPELPDGAESIILKAEEKKPDTENPGLIYSESGEGYNADAIVAAWTGGGANDLEGKNRSIYDVCAEVISSIITDGMDAWEKELAVHDWIIEWTSYDSEANNNAPDADPDPDNDNPYGLLIHKKSICTGYASTFKLFMDMLGIECIIVHGFSGSEETEHAWNMVRINGEWYCVDVGWDDPAGTDHTYDITHKYFNVTSQFMRDTSHKWDENLMPEATVSR